MARKKSLETTEILEPVSQETQETQSSDILKPEEVEPVTNDKAPKEVELEAPKDGGNLAPAVSKEEIEASIQEKLSRKTDKDGLDPFVPNVQLDNEVKDIANKKGFPLSRGTEIGARLMARSKRVK